jgi:hypothetical protein
MALVAKSNRIMTPKNSQRGQISIFFSASLVVFISVIAFVINVGLFVKAKINLQNATDASAFAGAAVQSRQLTKIAYLNWEMRNIFKEWMYKYYVVGSLNTPMVENPTTPKAGNDCGSDAKCMDFRLEADKDVLSGRVNFDPYNFPAVCIHIAGSKTNVCKRYAVPGLPEFGGYSIPGTEEASRSFLDVLIGEKINDCVKRSEINMLSAVTWAYNVLGTGDTLASRGPAILSDRQGAWPKAIELAMRIRNLEKVMNREASKQPVCIGGIGNCTAIDEITSKNFLGDERIVKAFYSGYRNLGNESDNEMKNSFTLQELPPKLPPLETTSSNSSLLIPSGKIYQKQFVDLKLMMVNYATFYAALVPRSEKDKSGACDISKVGLPVPGYPLGFYKNPDVLTYYAVKGEADFVGMFNPFSSETIKLTAYAAAKPIGGRIGPMLFKQKPTESSLKSRTDSGKYRSVPYISSLDVVGTPNPFLPGGRGLLAGEYGPGVPLPINLSGSAFWLETADSPIGGFAAGEKVQFGIPNLVYDFVSGDMRPDTYINGSEKIYSVRPKNSSPPSSYDGDKAVGLFNYDQFVAFRGNIGGEVSPEDLSDQISRVRAATTYEAANYLIPTPFELNQMNSVDSFGIVSGAAMPPVGDTANGLKRYNVDIYAPLYLGANDQQDLLYDQNAILSTVVEFMAQQEAGMQNYIVSLNKAALQIYQTALQGSDASPGAIPGFVKAANFVSDIPDVKSTAANYHETAFPRSCGSLAGQFWQFYYGGPEFTLKKVTNTAGCPVTLVSLLRTFFNRSASDPEYSPLHYKMEYNYYEPNWTNKLRIYSAYMPGPYNGISDEGVLRPPSGFPASNEVMRRNFYSTKLVTLDSVQTSGNFDESTNMAIYSEGDRSSSQATPDRKQNAFSNPLDAQSVGADIRSIRY